MSHINSTMPLSRDSKPIEATEVERGDRGSALDLARHDPAAVMISVPDRRCDECGAWFTPNSRGARFCRPYCRWRVRERKQVARLHGRRSCYRCGRELPLDEFAVDAAKASGHSSICLECDRVKSKEYYRANRERKLEQFAEYRAQHFKQRFCKCGKPTHSQKSPYCAECSEAAAVRRRFRKRLA
jgi:hypothetical protein